MIDKIKKSWYNVKKRVKERLPCGKKKQNNFLLSSFSMQKKSFLQRFVCACTGLSLSLFILSPFGCFTVSAEETKEYTEDDFLEFVEGNLVPDNPFEYVMTVCAGAGVISEMSGGNSKAIMAYFASVMAITEVLNNPIVVRDGDIPNNTISGFFNYDGKTYIGTLNLNQPFESGNKYRIFYSNLFYIDCQITALNSAVTGSYSFASNKAQYTLNRTSTFIYCSKDFTSNFEKLNHSSRVLGDNYTSIIAYVQPAIPDLTNYSFSGSSLGVVLGSFAPSDFPVGQPIPYDDIRNAETDAERAEIVDNYITDVLNPYYIDKDPSIEPYLYHPPQPEPTEPTDPVIYDPDNEPNDLFGWLRLIVQAIISLISGIVRPVVNAVNAVFSAISDGFAAVLAFFGGLFTPDISIIQTEIDFIQGKFAFVGQIKLFVNDFMGVLTGYDGSPPDVITVDFDNSNTGFLSNVVGKVVLIDLSWFIPYRLTVHAILSAMLWVFYLWRLFHQLPAVVAGQAAVEHMAEDAAKNP